MKVDKLYKYDVLILGAGLAGLRAATEIARKFGDRVRVGIVSKVQLMRAHSVCAEGGTAAVLRPEEGDSFELHAWDTIKGSDFLADQDVVFRFVRMMPYEILLLDHWGIPWSRRPDGKINTRPFGGHSFFRTVFAQDKTGFFEMQTLYDTLLKFSNYDRHDEVFATSFIMKDGKFAGLTAIDLVRGETVLFLAKSLIVATGGAGRLYGFTTYSHSVTGDGLAMAYRVGIPLKDMEFIQFHPTGLVPSGILVTEGARGEGGYLRNNRGERFMKNYAPSKMELAPRDIVSRAEMTEIEEGRGFKGPDGLDYVHLDLTHLGRAKILERLPLIRELAIKFAGVDPIEEPIPVRPVAHYSMGGIHANIDGQVMWDAERTVENMFVAGEAACLSLHGANRLGSNSTAECLVWGRITGNLAAEYSLSKEYPFREEDILQEAERELGAVEKLLRSDGKENPYAIRKELQRTMDKNVGVFRTREGLEKALEKIKELKKRFENISIKDKNLVWNTDLVMTMETGFLLDLAEVLTMGALLREESRGGHFRRDFPKRDDERWLKHTLAFRKEDGSPAFEYIPVRITYWKPVERKY
ncbi:MAG: succinate dehydrogenase/fumarate reductase flavoprotein subunit [Thermotogae bacterium]|nr:succinate dehydrogenase/fumarate reductase flavoprotein subunit [Thermotogota bacterium]